MQGNTCWLDGEDAMRWQRGAMPPGQAVTAYLNSRVRESVPPMA